MGKQLPKVLLGQSLATGAAEYVPLEKNLLTFAGAGSGKGATQIIVTASLWEHNLVVIDPSGEAAEACVKRLAKHQGKDNVVVFDPFEYANIDNSWRGSFNPLALVETATDLMNLAEGLITRTGRETQPHFSDSAEDAAAGLLAFIMEDPALSDDERHMGQLRHYIGALNDPTTKDGTIAAMKECTRYGGLAADIAKRLSPNNTEVQNILGTLRTQTRWLNSPEITATLSRSGFNAKSHFGETRPIDLKQLKNGKLSVFLVLPGDQLETFGRFLRVFVRMLIKVMMERTPDGQQLGSRALFILDEAYAVGKLKEVTLASGQMRKYGLHLWPFFQSLGQITELYGNDGLEILSEDADALTVFGVRGVGILEYASRRLGNNTIEDVKEDIDAAAMAVQEHERAQVRPYVWEFYKPKDGRVVQDQKKLADLAYHRSRIDRPRYTPDDLRELLAKKDGRPVPDRMLVFQGDRNFFVKPVPYFDFPEDMVEKMEAAAAPQRHSLPYGWLAAGAALLVLVAFPALLLIPLAVLSGLYGALLGWLPVWVQPFVLIFLITLGLYWFVGHFLARRFGGHDLAMRFRSDALKTIWGWLGLAFWVGILYALVVIWT